jgi:hypothetical protein
MIGQLSFDVAPRQTRKGQPAEVLGGELKIKGALSLNANLEHGDALTVTVANADGLVLTQSVLEVAAPPSFAPIEDKDLGLLGYSRVHTAKLADDQPGT